MNKIVSIEKQLELIQNNSCHAADVLISLVPLAGVILGSTLLFFFILWQYKLRKELIRTNQYKPLLGERIRLLSLLVGLLATFVGIPMTILFLAIDGVSYPILGGLLPMASGMGLIVFHYLSGKSNEN